MCSSKPSTKSSFLISSIHLMFIQMFISPYSYNDLFNCAYIPRNVHVNVQMNVHSNVYINLINVLIKDHLH